MSSVELVSPIPPIMTGTASYMELVGRRIGALAGALGGVRIVTDGDAWRRDGLTGEMPRNFCGLEVVSWSEVDTDPAPNVTRVYFLANNDKHIFVHQMLARQSATAAGHVISVLHDPSMFMVHRHMARASDVPFAFEDLVVASRSQLGASAERLMGARANEWLPDAFDFGVHCMGPALRKSDEIWTHSLYGANRVRFENDFSGARCRDIRVCAHPTAPDEPAVAGHSRRDDKKFRIGVFGWVTPPKRVDSVLRGLALALDRMDAPSRRRVRLNIVGRRPSKSDYDPEALAAQLGISEFVEFVDYPSSEVFSKLIAQSDLIFNLRYPSCGESSGTLASAEHLGVRVVASRFQAFREAVGVWRFINVAQPYEVWDVADAIVDAMAEAARTDLVSAPALVSGIAPVDKLLVAKILKTQLDE